jgi:hypothetical protein
MIRNSGVGMGKIRWQILFALLLVILSVLLYILHYLLFHDPAHIFLYLVGDIAFLPLQVLFVTLVIDRFLEQHEWTIRMEKMNMVIGTFFSALGSDLIARFSSADPGIGRIRRDLVVREAWTGEDFARVARTLQAYSCDISIDRMDLAALRGLLVHNQEFLLRLLENPALLEHESFTELLRTVFHLTEELRHRQNVSTLPGTDLEHLRGDIVRAYARLIQEWLEYMRYLRGNYPYLFSLAMRTNPFDEYASPIVR